MAAITLTELVPNDKVSQPAGSALTTDDTYQDIPIKGTPASEVILRIVVATAATTTTIKAGVMPPALAAGQGDLVFTNLATGTYFVGPLESGRFMQSNGNIQIKAATAANVTVSALHVPRTV